MQIGFSCAFLFFKRNGLSLVGTKRANFITPFKPSQKCFPPILTWYICVFVVSEWTEEKQYIFAVVGLHVGVRQRWGRTEWGKRESHRRRFSGQPCGLFRFYLSVKELASPPPPCKVDFVPLWLFNVGAKRLPSGRDAHGVTLIS